MKPSDDPKADKLVNSNLNQSETQLKDIYSDNTSGEEINDGSNNLPKLLGEMKVSDLPDISDY